MDSIDIKQRFYSVADCVEEVSEEETYRETKAARMRRAYRRGTSAYGLRKREPLQLVLKKEFRKPNSPTGTASNLDSTHVPLVKHFHPLGQYGKDELQKAKENLIKKEQ